MNRAAVISFGMVLAVLPSLASAKLQLRGEKVQPLPGVPGTYTMAIFAEPTDGENEQLGVYDIGFRLVPVNASPTGGVGFAPPYANRPNENFVFGANDPARYTYNVPTSVSPPPGPTQFLLNVESTGAGPVDVVSAVKVAEVVFQVAAGTLPSTYRVEFNPNLVAFGSLDPARLDPTIETTFSTAPDSGLIEIVPEPTSLSLLALGGLLALRRRRVA